MFKNLTEIKDHVALLLKALDAEKQQEEDYYESIASNQPIKSQQQAGLAVFPLRLNSQHYTVGDMIELSFEQTGNLDIKHKLRVGAGVQLVQTQSDLAITGVLSYVRRQTFKIMVHDDQLDGNYISTSQAYALRITYDSRPHNVMKESLNQILNHIGKDHIAHKVQAFYQQWQMSTPKADVTISEEVSKLNPSQINAISEAYSAFPYHVIHGPPGTGKTTTLIGLIQMLSIKEKNILVCAASNNAVDLLAEKCHEVGLNVVRVGNIARMSDDLIPLSLNEKVRNHKDWNHIKKVKIEAEEARKQAKKFKRSFGPEERRQRTMLMKEFKELKKWARDLEQKLVQQVLSDAQVIATTLIGSHNNIMKDMRFKTVIIDEASQTLEPECWTAILKAERVIFAGDHQQLPPTVKSNKAKELGLQVTLFDHLIKYDTNQSLLDTQYRMNDAILSYSNKRFYAGRLKSADQVKHHTIKDDKAPLVFIDTAGTGFEEEMNPQQRSYKNPGEFFIIREHMLSMIERIAGSTIGIISPYKEQVRHIQSTIGEIEEFNHLDIQIDSIDGFQGQEKDIIYISLVRSNDGNNIGFLEDFRRLNVALTRARKKLVIVGDSSTLVSSKMYNELVSHVETVGEFKSAWEYMSY